MSRPIHLGIGECPGTPPRHSSVPAEIALGLRTLRGTASCRLIPAAALRSKTGMKANYHRSSGTQMRLLGRRAHHIWNLRRSCGCWLLQNHNYSDRSYWRPELTTGGHVLCSTMLEPRQNPRGWLSWRRYERRHASGGTGLPAWPTPNYHSTSSHPVRPAHNLQTKSRSNIASELARPFSPQQNRCTA